MRLSSLLHRTARYVLPLLAVMLASASAHADQYINAPGGGNSAWTVYAFGNAQAVADAFRALNNFSSSATFQSIVGFIAILGMLGVGVSSGFSAAVARKFIGYAVSVFLICYIFFGVGNGGPIVVSVEVTDTVDNTWVAPVTVPMVVGIPASVISTAGHEITRQIEASFPMPDALKLSNGAPFNLAAALISDGAKAKIVDSNLASSMATYVQDCFTIAVARGDLDASLLVTSTDFLNDIKVDMPSVYVNTMLATPVGTPNLVSCTEAWTLINGRINANGTTAADYLSNASAWATTPALSVVNSAADVVAQWATNNGVTDGGAVIKQAAVLSQFSGAFRQAAATTGNSDFLTGLALTQAHEAQISGWVTGAEVFNRIMGYIFAILQVFVYALTPLILAASLIPGLGAALLKNFAQILLWLAIWQPMLGIVNFIILSMQQADLGGALSNGINAYGFTLSNLGIVTERTTNMRAAASFVGTMVPALAWAVVKGSVDFSRIIGAAVGEQFAQGAANTMSTGNYSLNQASMDSFTSNKHSVGHTGDFGYGQVSTGQGGMMSKIELGGGSLTSADQKAGVALSASTGTTVGGTGSKQASDTIGGSYSTSGVINGGHVRSGTIGDADNKVLASGYATSTSGALNPRLPAGARSADNPSGMGGLPGQPAGDGHGAGEDPMKKKNLPSRIADKVLAIKDVVNPSVQLSSQGFTNDTNQHSKTVGTSDAYTHGENGSRTWQGNEGANAGNSAALTHGFNENLNQQVSGIASATDRYNAMRPALEYRNHRTAGHASVYARPGSAEYAFLHPDSSVSRAAETLATPGSVGRAVDAEKAKVSDSLQDLEGEAHQRKKTAEKKEHEFEGAGAKGIRDVKAQQPALAAEAQVPAYKREAQALVKVGKDTYDAAGNVVHKGVEAVSSLVPDAVKQQGSHLREEAKDLLHRVMPGSTPAAQPHEQATHGKPQPQGGHDPANRVMPSTPAVPQPHEQATPQQPAQPAHAAPVAQAEQVQQQPQNHLASAGMPDPFNKGQQDPSSNLQSQVMMAQQQAERLSGNMRQVDGMLANADGMSHKELLDTVHQAQDKTRLT